MRQVLFMLMFVCSGWVAAEEMLMVRSAQSFPEAMLTLQEAIAEQGYTLSRVQRVDIGLTQSGFTTDKYRVVFLGKADELNYLSEHFPELIPYLPLKIAVFAEDKETLLVTANPNDFRAFYSQAELQPYFARWERDLRALLEQVREGE